MNLRNILLPLGVIAAVAVPSVSVISCGDNIIAHELNVDWKADDVNSWSFTKQDGTDGFKDGIFTREDLCDMLSRAFPLFFKWSSDETVMRFNIKFKGKTFSFDSDINYWKEKVVKGISKYYSDDAGSVPKEILDECISEAKFQDLKEFLNL